MGKTSIEWVRGDDGSDGYTINPTPVGIDCYVCDGEDAAGFGIPIYEDLIVPDEYTGEWGGVPVCRRCFYLVRGVQSEHPGKAIRITSVRALAAREVRQ